MTADTMTSKEGLLKTLGKFRQSIEEDTFYPAHFSEEIEFTADHKPLRYRLYVQADDLSPKLKAALLKAQSEDAAPKGNFSVGFDASGACWSRWFVVFEEDLTIEQRNQVYDVLSPIVDDLHSLFDTATFHLVVK